jgi:CopG family nickel-responsive transcriptional regulator
MSREKKLLEKLGGLIGARNYIDCSEAFWDMVHQDLVKKEWIKGEDIGGIITLIYGHHAKDVPNKITDIQHNYGKLTVSAQRVHINRENCLSLLQWEKIGEAHRNRTIPCSLHRMLCVSGTERNI